MGGIDALTAFSLGLALGFFLGAFVRKADRQLEFEKGRLHGINQLWPHLIAAITARVLAERRAPARDEAPGGGGGDQDAVHKTVV
jgi:hypothetical protein